LSKFNQKNFLLNDFNIIIIFLLFIWVIVSVLKVHGKIIAYRLFREHLWGLSHTNLPLKSVSTTATNLAREYQIKSDIAIIQSPLIEYLFVVGVKKIIIALPLEKYSDRDLNFILKHELTHNGSCILPLHLQRRGCSLPSGLLTQLETSLGIEAIQPLPEEKSHPFFHTIIFLLQVRRLWTKFEDVGGISWRNPMSEEC